MLAEVATLGGDPFVMLLDDGAPSQAQQGPEVGEHSDDVGEPLDFLARPFEGVGGPGLAPVVVTASRCRETALCAIGP